MTGLEQRRGNHMTATPERSVTCATVFATSWTKPRLEHDAFATPVLVLFFRL